jgi:hypothetical protein
MKIISLSALACLVFAAACGPTPCERTRDSLKRFEEKASKCTSGAKVRTLSFAACEQNFGNCSAADLNLLDAYTKCLDAVPQCDPAKPMDFKAAADACEPTADQFVFSCQVGLGT